ncbi:hypothetical protein BS50DRAFT_662780 [Corynespora cassiicola Philippines]|uniref:Dipeptidyl peptidase III n=1 Tax=Corynespora cassiicola Philippines TaxID=1448308 RepID=A0A2T2NZJ5_CORCC|nr:hypothetical protein BS50DRAFT_662780 [Corynespora cassiicola Philippines]
MPGQFRVPISTRFAPSQYRNAITHEIFLQKETIAVSPSDMLRPDLLVDVGAPVHQLVIRDAFEQLENEERLYAHWMRELVYAHSLDTSIVEQLFRAAFHGARIIMQQVSPESEGIKYLKRQTGVDDESLERFLEYAATVLANLGNYNVQHGYGGRKLLPRLDQDALKALCNVSERALFLCEFLADAIFAESPAAIGYPDEHGMSNYYPSPSTITKNELTAHLELRNTRLRKAAKGDETEYELMIASESTVPPSEGQLAHLDLGNCKVRLVYGDYSEPLQKMCTCPGRARQYSGSDVRDQYLQSLIVSLRSGNIEDHKKASISWLQDKEPAVETWSGFLESGRDPSGIQCEFEAFVTVKDKSWTKAFDELAEISGEFIASLPWVKVLGPASLGDFENEKFARPSFVALNLLCYCASNVWTGITGPGYDEVTSRHGPKNLTFSNRVSANGIEREKDYILEKDMELFPGHELLGHGCGKVFKENEGQCNFDPSNPPICPITNTPISSWYRPGETPELEQSLIDTLLSKTTTAIKDILFIGYLSIASVGVRALESYDLDRQVLAPLILVDKADITQKWGQAHDRARFGLLKCLHEAGDGFLDVEASLQPEPSLKLNMDVEEIESVGKRAVGDLILRLQVYKATRNQVAGTEIFTHLTAVDGKYTEWARIANARRKPRTLFIHPNTILNKEGAVELVEYPASKEGLIQSWLDRCIFS